MGRLDKGVLTSQDSSTKRKYARTDVTTSGLSGSGYEDNTVRVHSTTIGVDSVWSSITA